MHYKISGFTKGELGESSDLYYEKENALEEAEDFKEDFPCVLIVDMRNRTFDILQNNDGYPEKDMSDFLCGFKKADLLSS